MSRYDEDVSWTNNLSNVIIYNKGNPIHPVYGSIPLPNIGRESHTFFTYICDHYNTLDDYTVFLQGHPFDHCKDLLARLNALKYPLDFQYLADRIYTTNTISDVFYPRLRMVEFYTKIFGTCPEPSMKIEFGEGAQCIVSREAIQRRPLSFYQTILQQFGDYHYKNLDESADLNRLEPWILERLMRYIFT